MPEPKPDDTLRAYADVLVVEILELLVTYAMTDAWCSPSFVYDQAEDMFDVHFDISYYDTDPERVEERELVVALQRIGNTAGSIARAFGPQLEKLKIQMNSCYLELLAESYRPMFSALTARDRVLFLSHLQAGYCDQCGRELDLVNTCICLT